MNTNFNRPIYVILILYCTLKVLKIKMSQLQKKPKSILWFARYLAGLHRQVRSTNQTANILPSKAIEFEFCNENCPLFDNNLNMNNYHILVTTFTATACEAAKFRSQNPDNMEPNASHDFVRRLMPSLDHNSFWKTMGVNRPAILAEIGSGGDIRAIEEDVFECLLELGYDQNRAPRVLVGGGLDLSDATPVEIKHHKKITDAAFEKDRDVAEAQMGVGKGGNKRTLVTQGQIQEQEQADGEKSAAAKRLRLLARAAAPPAEEPVTIETQFGGLLTAITALKGAELIKLQSAALEALCVEAWEVIHDQEYFSEGHSVEEATTLMISLGAKKPKNLLVLLPAEIDSLCALLSTVGERSVHSIMSRVVTGHL
jgi:hypothetical protein